MKSINFSENGFPKSRKLQSFLIEYLQISKEILVRTKKSSELSKFLFSTLDKQQRRQFWEILNHLLENLQEKVFTESESRIFSEEGEIHFLEEIIKFQNEKSNIFVSPFRDPPESHLQNPEVGFTDGVTNLPWMLQNSLIIKEIGKNS